VPVLESPLIVFGIAFILLWASALAGAYLRHRRGAPDAGGRQDLNVILPASLTLLGLIIGFSFSMAVTRYDQRKNCEEEEANAIGTEYFRVTLLPSNGAKRMRGLLADYLNQRILFYTTTDRNRLDQVNAETGRFQGELWSVVEAAAAAQPTPVAALSVSGLNDVFNSQGYTQAAWWNRIPTAAWSLMGSIAVFCNVLFGYTSRHDERQYKLFLALPLVVAVSFFLISDLDSPRGGFIQVIPHNLLSVSHSIEQLSASPVNSYSPNF
jgi:hypothetical protein